MGLKVWHGIVGIKQGKNNSYLLYYKKTKHKNFNAVQKILKLKS